MARTAPVLFVDTSALVALLDADEAAHAAVRVEWAQAGADGQRLLVSNYVLLETVAVLQRRFGMGAVRDFLGSVVPVLEVEWVDAETHELAVHALLTANRRALSLVDCASFELMRRNGIDRAISLDPHFSEQGFAVVPAIAAGGTGSEVHEP